ncbi:hypothetical protein CDO44_20370 [Pigmentiphaga sp. NML080357]|uniref:zinc-ribbon and DUF3426 domain-containing protein n=1 Tax=Pigmentiphaga sp. NML080357 TaxID=2008675 RepID=UPI000B40B24B|nr:zinc-ribbon and DUF3426 domain-containing protein [Pigmentiphaga sp. NML080357]OVZ56579.1 hypothetical protein CDO44_20370 [Pigmentiphaga sp. NML080357]
MVLATRCPHCATAFRVVPDQVKLRGGWVRCGVCNEAFDSSDSLIELDPAGGPPRPVSLGAAPVPDSSGEPLVLRKRGEGWVAPPAHDEAEPLSMLYPPSPAEPVLAADRTASEDAPAAPAVQLSTADQPAVPETPEAAAYPPPAEELPVVLRSRRVMATGEAASLPAHDAPQEAAPPVAVTTPDAVPAVAVDRPPEPFVAEAKTGFPAPPDAADFLDDETRQRRRRAQWLWGLAALVALLVLMAQALWIFRAELATRVPQLRPLLEGMCQRLQCTVGYPRAPELLVIESSSVEPWSPESPGFAPPIADPQDAAAEEPSEVVLPVRRLALRIVLRNRAAFPQSWPAIELSLMDLSDAVAARRILQPSVYLPPQDFAKPLGPLEERTLRIPIETIDAHATGYRVAIFYP